MEMEILQKALEVAHEKNGLRGSRPYPKTIPSKDAVPRLEDCPFESSPKTSIGGKKASGSRSERRCRGSSAVEGDCRTETELRVTTDPGRPEPNTKDRGMPPVNHKRGYRILKGNGLLLTRGMPRPEREILTGIGAVSVRIPKVRSRTGEPVTFRLALLPPYVRKTKSLEAALP